MSGLARRLQQTIGSLVMGTGAILPDATLVTGGMGGTNTVAAPNTIDATGTSDVSADLATWFNSLADGTIATFPAGSCYRVDHPVQISGVNNLTIDGTNATGTSSDGTGSGFFTNDPTGDTSTVDNPDSGARTRMFLDIEGCHDVIIQYVNWTGPNATGGVNGIYNANLEAQHFVNISGGSYNITVRFNNAKQIFGDFVYVGGVSYNVWVHDNTFAQNGRQGTSVCNGYNVLIENNNYDQIRRTVLDLEPATTSWFVRDVTFRNNTVGAHRLNFVSANAANVDVSNIAIVDNNCNSGMGSQLGPGSTTTVRPHDWTFSRNIATSGVGGPSGHAINVNYIDNFTGENNVQPLQSGRNMYIFGLRDCTNARIDGNQYPGGIGEYQID